MKKIIIFVITTLFCSAVINAQNLKEVDSGVCGDKTEWILTSDGTITISGTGSTWDWEYSYFTPWTGYIKDIKSVVVEKGVTRIGDNAFTNFEMASLTAPNVDEYGDYAFYSCKLLKTINRDMNAVLGNYSFDADANLQGLMYAGTTLIGYFGTMPENTKITIKEGTKKINISAFNGYTQLTEVVIPNSVEVIEDNAFYNCSGLTKVTMSDNVKSIGGYAFFNCSALSSIKLPNTLTSVGSGAFMLCAKITDITLPANIDYVGADAFAYTGWQNALEPTLPKDAWYLGNSLYKYLGDKNALTSFQVLNGTKYIDNSAFMSCAKLESIVLPASVEMIGMMAFQGCSLLSSIIIPNNVSTIDAMAFKDCTSLGSVNIPAKCVLGPNAFENCTALTSVTVPDGVDIPYRLFYNCTNLATINFAGSITNVGTEAFDLTKWITLQKGVVYAGTTLFKCFGGVADVKVKPGTTCIAADAFKGCEDLISITIPSSVKYIWSGAFNNCPNVESIVYDRDNVCWVDFSLVAGKEKLKKLVCPANALNTLNSTFVFDYVGTLQDVKITDGHVNKYTLDLLRASAGSLKNLDLSTLQNSVIWENAFKDFTKLESVSLSEDVNIIEANAFNGCSAIKTMNVIAVVPPVVEANALNGVSREIKLTVPNNDYKNADVWSEFFANDPTAVEDISVNSMNVYTMNGRIMIEGGEEYAVFNAAGVMVYNGNAGNVELPKGVYIVRGNGWLNKVAL